MKTTINKINKCEVELEVEIPKEELDDFIEKAAVEFGKNIEVEGFRKGKAPKNIIEEKVGKENILAEAAEMAIEENYGKAVLENKIEPISQPKIEIVKLAQGNPLIFKATTTVLPEIKLPDYKKIAGSLKKNKIEVLNSEIEEAVKWLLKSRAKFSQKNGPVEKGDFVEINYKSNQIKSLDNKKGQKDAFVLGEGQFIPGFEDNIIGLKAGEEKEFSVTFPSDYFVKELTDKKVDFKVKIESVSKAEIPEANDDFAKSLGKFDNLEALKENIKKGINLEKKNAESYRIRHEIIHEVSEKAEMEIPEVLIEKEQDALLSSFKHEVEEKVKVNFDEYLGKIKKTEKEIKDSFLNKAKEKVREFLTLKEIGIKEKIEVKEEEIKEETDKFLRQYENVNEAKKNIDVLKLKNYTKEVVMNEKIFSLLENLTQK